MMKYKTAAYLVATILICFPFRSSADPINIVTGSSHGYRVVIDNASWFSSAIGECSLDLDFHVLNQDGTPAVFGRAQPQVLVGAWSLQNMNMDPGAFARASYAGKGRFGVGIPNIDPRNESLHIDFDVEDPKASDPASWTSDITFKAVPIPTAMDVEQPANMTYTTPLGAVITLRGVTCSSHALPGLGGPPATLFDIAVDSSRSPGESMSIKSVAAYDGITRLQHTWSYNDLRTVKNGLCMPDYDAIQPGSFKTLDFVLNVSESRPSTGPVPQWFAYSCVLQGTQIKLNEAYSKSRYSALKIAGESDYKLGGATFHLYTIKDTPDFGNVHTFIESRSANPDTEWFMQDFYWAGPGVPKPNMRENTQQLEWHGEDYWNHDGSPVAPGQVNAQVRTFPRDLSWPIMLTMREYKRRKLRTLTFENVPLPPLNQPIELNIIPKEGADSGFQLTKVFGENAGVTGRAGRSLHNSRQMWLPTLMAAVLTYRGTDEADVSVGTRAAIDDRGDSLAITDKLNSRYSSLGTTDGGPSEFLCIFTQPPASAKSFTLEVVVDNESAAGDPVTFSIDKGGAWTIVKPTPPKDVDP